MEAASRTRNRADSGQDSWGTNCECSAGFDFHHGRCSIKAAALRYDR